MRNNFKTIQIISLNLTRANKLSKGWDSYLEGSQAVGFYSLFSVMEDNYL
jgi:hypothetical protein